MRLKELLEHCGSHTNAEIREALLAESKHLDKRIEDAEGEDADRDVAMGLWGAADYLRELAQPIVPPTPKELLILDVKAKIKHCTGPAKAVWEQALASIEKADL